MYGKGRHSNSFDLISKDSIANKFLSLRSFLEISSNLIRISCVRFHEGILSAGMSWSVLFK